MMKRIITLFMAWSLLFVSSAFAEGFVPSITTQDLIRVTFVDEGALRDTDVKVLVDLYTAEDYELLTTMGEQEKIYGYFPAEVQLAIKDYVIPDEVENLAVSDFIPLHFTGYDAKYEDLKLNFEMPVDYVDVLGVVGLLTTDGETWYVLPATVDEVHNEIEMIFTVDALTAANDQHAILAILTY